MTIKDMRDRRAKLIADQRAIVAKAEAENRAMNAEELTQIEAMDAEVRQLRATIEARERLDAAEAESRNEAPETQRRSGQPGAGGPGGGDAAAERRAQYERSMGRYLRGGFGVLSTEEREALQTGRQELGAEALAEVRAQGTTLGSAGGFLVAPDTRFYGRIVEALRTFGNVEGVAEVLNTDTGADLPIATDDDTSNEGAIVGENVASGHAGGTDVSIGQRVLRSYLYSSKVVKVSWQLLRDSGMDIESYLGRKLGMRLARIRNRHFTVGTGASQPQGIAVAAPVGRTAAAGNTTSVPADDLFRLLHSVDPAYRDAPSAAWMMHDDTLLLCRLLKDTTNQYIFQAGLQAGQPDRLLNKPINVNNHMPTPAASAKTIVFGDLKAYYVRNVSGITIVRLGELYAESGQVGFLAYQSSDGGLVDAGQGPIKAFQHSAS